MFFCKTDLFRPDPEGHRVKLIPPVESLTPIFYMSVIHLKAVAMIVSEIFSCDELGQDRILQ